jgi:hypothetical protein
MIKDPEQNRAYSSWGENAGRYSRALALGIAVFLFLYILLKIIIISLSWLYSFEEVVAIKHEKTPLFHEIMAAYDISLSVERYHLARWLSPVLFLSFISLTALSYKLQAKWFHSLTSVCRFVLLQVYLTRQSYRELSGLQKIFLLIVLLSALARQIFLVFYLPPHVDELETYYVFVKEGFIWTNIFYPFPNNHVFFNYFFWLSHQLIDDPLLAVRIPSVIFYQILLLLVFFGVRRYLKNTEAAFGSILLCLSLFPSSIYGAQGRGYILFSILLLVTVYALFIALENKKWQKQALTIFAVSSALGAYTIPVFLLPFISMLLLAGPKMFFKPDKVLFGRLLVSIVMVGIMVGFLYLPIFLFSGIEPVIANKYIQPSQTSNFFDYVTPIASAEILSYLAAVPSKGWLIWLMLGGFSIGVLAKSDGRTRNWLILSALMILTIMLQGLLMRSFMYERTTTYAVYLLYPAVMLILVYWTSQIFRPTVKKALYGIGIAALPIIGYFQYQDNIYEGSMLPNVHTEVVLKYNQIALDQAWTVYFSGTYWSIQFCVMVYDYFCEINDQPDRRVSDYHEAEMVVVDKEIHASDTFDQQEHRVAEEFQYRARELEGFTIFLKKQLPANKKEHRD